MSVQLAGLPALIVAVGFIIVFSAPVWLAARLVGAKHPSLLRAAASLLLGSTGSVLALLLAGGFGLLLSPLAYLFAFKKVLGTSFLGAIGLAIVAALGYAVMLHLFGAGLAVDDAGGTTAWVVRAWVATA